MEGEIHSLCYLGKHGNEQAEAVLVSGGCQEMEMEMEMKMEEMRMVVKLACVSRVRSIIHGADDVYRKRHTSSRSLSLNGEIFLCHLRNPVGKLLRQCSWPHVHLS